MAIGSCEICDAQNVPGSIGGSDVCTDGFFCFLCQGDEFDPYSETEIEAPCSACGGEGRDIRSGIMYEPGCGHAHYGDVDHGRCEACKGSGSEWAAPQLITAEDLAEMCGDLQ